VLYDVFTKDHFNSVIICIPVFDINIAFEKNRIEITNRSRFCDFISVGFEAIPAVFLATSGDD
jgi:hypothetical protein